MYQTPPKRMKLKSKSFQCVTVLTEQGTSFRSELSMCHGAGHLL